MLTEQADRIPVLKEGHMAAICPPEALSFSLAVFMLCHAKKFVAANPPPAEFDIASALDHFNSGKRLEELSLWASYTTADGSQHDQCFRVVGLIRGNANVIKAEPNDQGAYELDRAGISAWLDDVKVIPND
jgi:hypothetical protein